MSVTLDCPYCQQTYFAPAEVGQLCGCSRDLLLRVNSEPSVTYTPEAYTPGAFSWEEYDRINGPYVCSCEPADRKD